MNDVIEALLTAHVEHELSRLRGDGFAKLLDEHVGAALRWLGTVKLNDVATRARVAGVIDRNVIELRVSGGITELAGEMARAVLNSKSAATVTAGDVLPADAYAQ